MGQRWQSQAESHHSDRVQHIRQDIAPLDRIAENATAMRPEVLAKRWTGIAGASSECSK